MLLTVKESAINVPQNLEARRRITFFANSLFMNMPSAPKVRNMLSFRLVMEKEILLKKSMASKWKENGLMPKLVPNSFVIAAASYKVKD